jgi:alpha-D-xyloside xylohydrolase
VTERYGFDSLPLLVRPGTVLPVGAGTQSPEYDWADGVTLRLFELPDGFSATIAVPAAQAVGGPDTLFDVVREGSQVRVTSPSTRPWRVQVGDRAVDGGPSGAVIDL